MSDPTMISGIQEAVTIPVMAKARIGHFAEAQVLEALEVDYVDESEVLTPADEAHHIDKWAFKVPFVCGATNLGEALRRIGEGAAMIRSKGEAGHRRHRRGRPPPARDHAARSAACGPARGGAAPAPPRSCGRRSTSCARRGGGPLPVVAVLRRRHRHAGRRVADDAARRGGRLRRLGHLQVRGPRGPRAGDRRGHDPLPRPRARRRAPRGLGAAMRASRHASSTSESCSPPRLVARAACPPRIGVLALQGDFEAHAPLLRDARRRASRGRVPPSWTGSTA